MEKKEKDDANTRSSFWKAWEVLFPYLLYYLTYNAVYLILIFVFQNVLQKGGACGRFVTDHAVNAAGVLSGLCMLIGILPLVPMLKEELRQRRETADTAGEIAKGIRAAGRSDESTGAAGESAKRVEVTSILTKKVNEEPRRMSSMTAFTVLLALSASLGLNALLTLTGFADSSQTYQEVADRQYGVAFALGLVLYGVISPLAEEVVFRGVIYNRLRRFYHPAIAIVVSGLFFGAFHGNLVQGMYGACLGMLMAYLYERSGRFFIPVLFHAAANLAVYTTAWMEGVQEFLFTPAGCAVLLAVAAGGILMERWRGKVCSAKHG